MDNISLFKERLKHERKNAQLTLESLAEIIHTSRQTISLWEKGASSPSVHDLIKLCEVFECDFGYLVGEYDCRTRQATDIQAEIGLSEKAINKLLFMNTLDTSEELDIISSLMTNPYFLSAVQKTARFLSISKKCKERDSELKKAKEAITQDDYYTIHAITDEIILSQTGVKSTELQASELGILYKLSALDDFQSALRDVMKGMGKHGTDS